MLLKNGVYIHILLYLSLTLDKSGHLWTKMLGRQGIFTSLIHSKPQRKRKIVTNSAASASLSEVSNIFSQMYVDFVLGKGNIKIPPPTCKQFFKNVLILNVKIPFLGFIFRNVLSFSRFLKIKYPIIKIKIFERFQNQNELLHFMSNEIFHFNKIKTIFCFYIQDTFFHLSEFAD